LELAEEIKAAKLPASTGRLLPKFMQDVKDRASPDYEARIRERVQHLWTARDYAGIIETLRDHPFVLPPADMAFIRGVCCEELGKYRAAVLFFADAANWSQNNPRVMAALVPLPLNLADQGRLADAWEYAQAQLELWPNVVSYAVASSLCYQRAFQVEGDTRKNNLREQAQYFDRAREEYARLPAAHRDYPVIREIMGLAYEDEMSALLRAGSTEAAREMCDAAIAFDPASPNGWTFRGIILSTGAAEARLNPEAAAAFKKAVALGDKTYLPYYYLAHDAMTKGEFRDALQWSRQALARGERQDAQIKSLLYQWEAISLAHLGGPRGEIEGLFRKAVEAAPDNEFARTNYRHFQTSGVPVPPPFARPNTENPLEEGSRYHPDRNAYAVDGKLAAVAS
jgi:tetratricopeptide (TPR) repeat protein